MKLLVIILVSLLTSALTVVVLKVLLKTIPMLNAMLSIMMAVITYACLRQEKPKLIQNTVAGSMIVTLTMCLLLRLLKV